MFNSRAEAFAPATVANIGVGFDVLGLAIAGSGDTIIAEWNDMHEVIIVNIEGDHGKLPYDSKKNVASIAASALLQQAKVERGVNLWLKKGLPLSSGLGSSAASAVAAVVAVNALMGEPFSREELLAASLEGEAAVSGYHADNVAPCLFGGITLTNGITPDRIRNLPVPKGLFLAFVTPDVEVPTSTARAVLPVNVSLKTMVHQTGAVAELIDALYRSDIPAMARAMESDRVVEPARQHLMPYMLEMRELAKQNGALGLVISGAGPTLCAVCDQESIAKRVSTALREGYAGHNMGSISRYGGILAEGSRAVVFS